MTPARIVKAASQRGLSMIALSDHNTAENTPYLERAAANSGVTAIAGIEITSSEEVHILTLFEHAEKALAMQEEIYRNLPDWENDERQFGEQVVVNEKDDVLGYNRRFLIGATGLSVQDILEKTRSLGGLSIASHIDREAFGILSQLGFIPESLKLDALELSMRTGREVAEERYSVYRSFPWITSSDSHRLEDIGKRYTDFHIHEPTIAEISSALKNINGRKVTW